MFRVEERRFSAAKAPGSRKRPLLRQTGMPCFVACSGFRRGLAWVMIKTRILMSYFALALMSFLPANAQSADQPAPLWKIDLRPLGYKHVFIGRKTTVRFWRNYLVIEQASVPVTVQDSKTHDNAIRTDPAPPSQWVFDVRDHKQVSPTTIAHAEWEPLPEITPYPGWEFLREDHIYVTARWKDMVISRHTRTGDMYLDEPGQERKTICHGDDQCRWGGLVFVSAKRLAVCSQYMAMDGTGKRYARYETYLGGFFPQLFNSLSMGEVGAENRASVRVFSVDNDRELFVFKWKEKQAETVSLNEPRTQYNRLIALSEDGSLLAVVRRSELLLFQLPAGQE